MAPPLPGIDQLQQPPPPPLPTGQSVLPPSGAFPGSLTPGWNDPPPLAMDSSNNRRPRLDLRKRVAYPMDGSTIGSNAISVGNAPPLDMAAGLANPLRPVAMVPPQRQAPYVDYGSGSTSSSNSGSSNNNNSSTDAARLPPVAIGSGDLSKVPVAMVPPRQK
ncbi:protein diaphanous homolog 1 [Drosophila willistoni]|uniref:protein diaphanous homolog 1 n=1 Tax=Drosophila willistoni TaxID=7260 RepID=UPI000C26CC58|nr:protein diaphanous homolog 1 [Drosophila willistoni]XP_046867088.1 protein diaphanous homolog 1 [Drosophila willistoni]